MTEEDLGVYTIEVNVTDEFDASTSYEMVITVTKPFLFEGVIIEEVEEVVEIKYAPKVVYSDDIPIVSARMESIDKLGKVVIVFSEEL